MMGFLTRPAAPRHHPLRCWILLLGIVLAPSAVATEQDDLRARYRALTEGVADNPFHAPISVHSTKNGDVLSADVYGVIAQSFDAVAAVIGDPRSVCDFVSLSINIKACTAAPASMTWYMGRKDYGEPDPDQAVHYRYTVTSRTPEKLQVRLHAPQGLLGITDNLIAIDVAAVEGRTLVHFAISYVGGFQSQWAMETYLLTFGRNKIGFSMYPDADGKPIAVKGAQGIIERNVMRYYLALQAYLDTAAVAPDQRDRARIERWFDYSERFAEQLHELPREAFLDNKKRERLNQQSLQSGMDAAAKPADPASRSLEKK